MEAFRPAALAQRPAGDPVDWPRIRFAACLAVYGAAIGAAAVLVNFLSQGDPLEVPQHMPFGPALLFSSAAALAGIVITGPVSYWLYGQAPVFYANKYREPRSFLVWTALGLGYGLLFPLLMGAYFLPMSFRFLDFVNGILNVPELVSSGIDLVLMSPFFSVILGFQLFFTGLIAGVLFGVGAWVIDRFNTSADPATARYGTWAMALALSAIVIAIVAFGPVSTLSRLG